MNPDGLANLLAAQNILVLQRKALKGYIPIGQIPDWITRLHPASTLPNHEVDPADWFPFLEEFLNRAEQSIAAHQTHPLRSGWWTETDADDQPMEMEATFHFLPEGNFLLVRILDVDYDQRSRILQKARETSLALERMLSESSKKEILLHCIIHDLSGPLSGMQGCLEMLVNEPLSPQGKRFLELGRIEANKQTNLIKDLLDVFAMEIKEQEETHLDPDQAPDLMACIRSVLEGMSSAFALKKVRCVFDPPSSLAAPCLVRGETSRLERILYNLLQNALRHSIAQATVQIQLQDDPDSITVQIHDEGPGVPESLRPQLFQKFVKGIESAAGKVGLGLFFCRITLERWGGAIQYSPRHPRGSTFSVTLRKLS